MDHIIWYIIYQYIQYIPYILIYIDIIKREISNDRDKKRLAKEEPVRETKKQKQESKV